MKAEPSLAQTSHDLFAEPANDNREDAFTPDDILMLAVMVVIFAGALMLLIYIMLGGTDDVVSMLRK